MVACGVLARTSSSLLAVCAVASIACGPTTAPPTDDVVACADAAPEPPALVDTTGADPRGLCPGGALVAYSLIAPATLPAVEDLALPDLPAGARVVAAGGDDVGLRLDVCTGGDGTVALRGVVSLFDAVEPPRVYVVDDAATETIESFVQTDAGFVHELRVPPTAFLVRGLDALLAGDAAAFELRVVGASGLLAVGHDGSVAVARGDVDATAVAYTNIDVVVGALARGDAFAARPCPFGEQATRARFALGSAAFIVDLCTFMGGGHTTGYRVTTLRVQDAAPALRGEERACIELAGADLEEALETRWNHHNACDSFHLALPHAEYAATSSPNAGCGETLPAAPAPAPLEENGADVRWRLRHHGGPWSEGTSPGCSHYLFCGETASP